jgi:general secretion pathway protein C
MNLPASLQFPATGSRLPLERLYRHLPQITAALLVVAIAWQGVQLTWVLRGRNPQISAITPVSAPVVGAMPARIDVQSIANAHLFGAAAAENTDPNNAPPTQVNLVLAGVMAAEDPKRGYAIIGESAANAKVHTVGQSLPGGVRLYAVYPDRVLIDRNSQIETLRLPRQTPSFAPQPRAAAVSAPAASFADNLRRIAQSNPSALNEVLRPQPVFANGTQRGYRVYPGRDRQQFAKLGLQPGDLVTSINGTPLDDPNRGQEIFNTLASSDHVNVTVERNGQPQQLTLNTAQISLPQAAESAGVPPQPIGAPARGAETETQ